MKNLANIVQYSTVLYCTVGKVQYCIVLLVQYITVMYCTVSTIQYCTALTTQYSYVLYGIDCLILNDASYNTSIHSIINNVQ